MIKNLYEYFLPEQEFYLQNIDYDRIETLARKVEFSLNCSDSITAEILDDMRVKIIVTRSLSFDPNAMFQLSISFGANLRFKPQKYSEYNWNEINLAEEFRNNGDFVIGNLMGRVSLLIAQITSSFGQQPLVLPPNVVKSDTE
jgi:hypothetical protein